MNRGTTRLAGHTYGAGSYFVTVCVHEREGLFGEVVDGAMCLNNAGRVVVEELCRTVELRAGVTIDAFVVMPNHVHVILSLADPGSATVRRGMACHAPEHRDASGCVDGGAREFGRPVARSLGTVIGAFKSAVTKRTRQTTDRVDPVWQRGYHEHIIREHDDIEVYRRYIAMNPVRWAEDEENPSRF